MVDGNDPEVKSYRSSQPPTVISDTMQLMTLCAEQPQVVISWLHEHGIRTRWVPVCDVPVLDPSPRPVFQRTVEMSLYDAGSALLAAARQHETTKTERSGNVISRS